MLGTDSLDEEHEYNQRYHREIGSTPIDCYLQERRVGRECPGSEALREAFQRTDTPRQRRSDGTLSLAGVRYEVPSRYRQLGQIRVRYAQWDLSHVQLLDPKSDAVLCRLYPLDKHANADGQRRLREPIENGSAPIDSTDSVAALADEQELPPLMRQWQAEFAATGLPPAYIKPAGQED